MNLRCPGLDGEFYNPIFHHGAPSPVYSCIYAILLGFSLRRLKFRRLLSVFTAASSDLRFRLPRATAGSSGNLPLFVDDFVQWHG